MNNSATIEPRATSHEPPTFCALFDIKNEHIVKDHGLLSWGMHEYHGYDSFMATYKNDDYPNLKYLPGLRMEFVPKVTGDWLQDSCAWLRENAKRINVLYIYHIGDRSLAHILAYKRNNPHGKVFLKMDGSPRPPRFFLWKGIKPLLSIHYSTVVSSEFQENAARLSKFWPKGWFHKVIWIPNPANPSELQDFRPFSERSNTILTVGRLGTRQKATEILLEAFAKIADQIPDWTLKLAGYISGNMNIASDFYAAHPELKERVIFTGEIRDRQTLIEMYRDAKIFAFPSRGESFGIALTEAIMQGCFAVTTDIPTSRKLTENFRYALGSEVDDIDGLAKNLLYACTHEPETESLAREGMTATRERIDLRRTCERLAEGLK